MATALGIAQDASGKGTDALQLRKIIQSRWASTGIVTGLGCSGRSDLRYQLAAGVAVTQRSTSDGCTEAYWQGGTTAAVATGDASNPRIDVVYLKANDPSQGDADNQVIAGVAQGNPAASPVQPSIPAGSVAVATMRMPAGATATNAAISMAEPRYALPYGGSLGILDYFVDTWDGTENPASHTTNTNRTAQIILPTRRWIELDWARCMNATVASNPGSILVKLSIDGVPKVVEEVGTNSFWETKHVRGVFQVEAGLHTVTYSQTGRSGGTIWYHYDAPDGGATPTSGLTCITFDRGVA